MEDGQERQIDRGGGGGLIGLIIFIAVCWWVYNHFINKPTWTAIYYPNPSNLTVFSDQAVGSLDECRSWVRSKGVMQNNYDYDYECGTNCKLKIDYIGKFYYCKETFE